MKKAFILATNNKPKWVNRFSLNFIKIIKKSQASIFIVFSMQNESFFIKISKNNKKKIKNVHFSLEKQHKMECIKNAIHYIKQINKNTSNVENFYKIL